ncbi:MAG: SDR family NAD(P)-dependent oxidoreductase [Salinisphaeraceae bacterium]|nr:SDR family NAD(P)-dependent oxidoreductase [Salinisphaeraceae bacterium]
MSKPDNHLGEPCPDLSGLGSPRTGPHWTVDNIPDLSGKRALVTGGAGGLGKAAVHALVEHGAEVVLADVNADNGQAAALQHSQCEFRHLDLGSLEAIRCFAEPIRNRPLDILINLAGIYPPAKRTQTVEGLELAMAINFWGHFALTAHLMPALLHAEAARVVSISSITQAWGKLDFLQPEDQRRYQADKLYASSKLACLMFGLELHERAQVAKSTVQSMIAHPGIARTTLGAERKQGKRGLRARMEDAAQAFAMRVFGQEAEQGVLPILFAATSPKAESGGFYGPHGLGQFSGYPVAVRPAKTALNKTKRAQLWQQAEKTTQISVNF